ncbi:hypothetical protein ACTJK8_28370 [Methylobacterium sp. 22177]
MSIHKMAVENAAITPLVVQNLRTLRSSGLRKECRRDAIKLDRSDQSKILVVGQAGGVTKRHSEARRQKGYEAVMGGFFRVEFQARTDQASGSLALANGKVAGLDVGGGIYRGSYVEEGGRARGTAILSFPDGGELVTGMRVPPGAEITIPFDIPVGNSTNIHGTSVNVAGRRVDVIWRRIADL